MPDPSYPIPPNPVYDPDIRQLQNTDKASAEDVFNPLFRKIINNIHAVKQSVDENSGDVSGMAAQLAAIASDLAAVAAGLGTAAAKNTGTSAGEVPVLDSGGKLDTKVMPSLALTETYVVSTQASMLALAAQPGDVAIRTDISKTYILAVAPSGTLANWKEFLTPASPVQSVAGKTGAVTLSPSDVGAAAASHGHTAAEVGAVPTARKVNNKALSSDISLGAGDVGAAPSSHSHSASSVGAVPTSRKVNGKALSADVTLSGDDLNGTMTDAAESAALPPATTVAAPKTLTQLIQSLRNSLKYLFRLLPGKVDKSGDTMTGSLKVIGDINAASIELRPYNTAAGFGGFIDFHFNDNTADNTSRIIEDAAGRININGHSFQRGVPASVSEGGTGRSDVSGIWDLLAGPSGYKVPTYIAGFGPSYVPDGYATPYDIVRSVVPEILPVANGGTGTNQPLRGIGVTTSGGATLVNGSMTITFHPASGLVIGTFTVILPALNVETSIAKMSAYPPVIGSVAATIYIGGTASANVAITTGTGAIIISPKTNIPANTTAIISFTYRAV